MLNFQKGIFLKNNDENNLNFDCFDCLPMENDNFCLTLQLPGEKSRKKGKIGGKCYFLSKCGIGRGD